MSIAKCSRRLVGKGGWNKPRLCCNGKDSIKYATRKCAYFQLVYDCKIIWRTDVMKKTQMTAATVAGASSAKSMKWEQILWPKVEANVRRLQMRIAEAERNNRTGKVKALQWLLTHSVAAKLLAVKMVTSSSGSKTTGIDGKLCKANEQKIHLTLSLKQRGYKALPLKRIYIPKKNGTQRPLGIPTMRDRAMQALYLLALEPVAEMRADPNSYGFRPCRSAADAEERCFKILCNKKSAQWILEGDIKSCFDKISHEWLLRNIPTEKRILKQWLSAGYMEKQTLFPTSEGTPQGGVISPVLANLTLDGLEDTVINAVKSSKAGRVHVVRYADDFVCMAANKEILESTVKPVIIKFLTERGLELSMEKTTISNVFDGFDFLGFNIRKNKKDRKLLVKPAKKNMTIFLDKIRTLIKSHKTAKTEILIGKLNPKIRGWANYYKHVVAKRIFGYVDDCIYRCISQWTRRRHNNKNFAWIKKQYFRKKGYRNWIFYGTKVDSKGNKEVVDLFKANYIPIKRHIQIRQGATPYDPAFTDYLAKRKKRKHDKTNKLYHYWQISNIGLFCKNNWIHQSAAR